MENNPVVTGIGAALGVAFLAYSFTLVGSGEPELSQAPELQVPIDEISILAEDSYPVSPLFSEFAPTGNSLFDDLLFPERQLTTISGTTTHSVAGAAGILKTKKATTTFAVTVSPKQALTANTLALRGAAVNIICIPKDGSVKAVSGSGVIIDSRGLILTVAHVAQMYLLKDYPTAGNIRCVIRTGSPATAAYTADLVYISPTWIQKSPDTLVAVAPTGTGAHDFALLAITGSATATPLPYSFPSVPLAINAPEAREAVGVGSYGAQYLDNTQKHTGLYQTLVYGVVTKPFTFTTNKIEALSVKAGSAAQLGSSGGGVVNTKGEYVGLITNSAITGDFSTRELRAITPFHIRTSFENDTDTDLDSYLSDHTIQELTSLFTTRAQRLTDIVINAIN